jgi:Nucleotidyltransferase of unknown function (DUF6036)
MLRELPEPWQAFFLSIDAAVTEPISLHCLGGFAAAMLYDLPRPTGDVDIFTAIPAYGISALQELAGKGSDLHRLHNLYIQHVAVVTLPESYADRLIEIPGGVFNRLHLFGLEVHDLALSKLERNSARDREDIKHFIRAAGCDYKTLESRYQLELRPYLPNVERYDLTIRLWREMTGTDT